MVRIIFQNKTFSNLKKKILHSEFKKNNKIVQVNEVTFLYP